MYGRDCEGSPPSEDSVDDEDARSRSLPTDDEDVHPLVNILTSWKLNSRPTTPVKRQQYAIPMMHPSSMMNEMWYVMCTRTH